MSVEQNQGDEERAMVDKHVNQLAEHFDTVHIFVTKHLGEKDKTWATNRASGNWFARYGQLREWVTFEDERIREYARPTPD